MGLGKKKIYIIIISKKSFKKQYDLTIIHPSPKFHENFPAPKNPGGGLALAAGLRAPRKLGGVPWARNPLFSSHGVCCVFWCEICRDLCILIFLFKGFGFVVKNGGGVEAEVVAKQCYRKRCQVKCRDLKLMFFLLHSFLKS